ncbi:MAG: hypothetical protein GY928_20740 [Colwellia sp.]|nr:hypothetical protein [Colwellia sp.]
MDKWLAFKNYLHNELGITKEDIRCWIREAVQEVAEGLVKEEFGKFKVKTVINDMIMDNNYWGNSGLKKEIKDMVASSLVDQINLRIKG